MATTIQIRVWCEDDTDADWLKYRVTGAVDEIISDQREQGRLDGKVEMDYDLDTVN